jgi:hypothetical protein
MPDWQAQVGFSQHGDRDRQQPFGPQWLEMDRMTIAFLGFSAIIK